MMASFGVFVLIFIFTLSYQPSPLVRSDYNLIKSLCSKADFPIFCLHCLTSDPSSKTASPRALSIIAIHCAENEANLWSEATSNLYERAPNGSPLKKILQFCAGQAFVAREDFTAVLQSVIARDYGGAKYTLTNQIQPLVDSCKIDFLNNPNVPMPFVVAAGIQKVTIHCKNVEAILSNI
uniref:Pectinesterase inhibitor domain-containing protein n=1 Tax=Fagus sylvatica TaxID=28930 RepID=A0A2N9I117_FAGSY